MNISKWIFLCVIATSCSMAYCYTWHVQNTTDVMLKVRINATGSKKVRTVKPGEIVKVSYNKWYNKGLCLTDVHFKRNGKGKWHRAKHAAEEFVGFLSALPVAGQIAGTAVTAGANQNLCKSNYVILLDEGQGIRYKLSNESQ